MAAPFRPHLLVIDDEACVREALSAALDATYVVHLAASGAEASALLQTQPIAGISLDVRLGDEHGLDLVPRFHALTAVPILVLTGHSSEEVLIRSVWAGVDGYLKKPINLAELRAAIHRLVPQTDSGTDLAERARRYLEMHLAAPLCVAAVAGQLRVSEIHLRRCFRAAYNKTPGRYLTELRMGEAARLLTTTALGVDQIAQRVGYQSAAAFGRIFRRAHGSTPSDYRTRLPRSS
ncbi:MAG TPA: helix-turn-helix domain-containing protein [Candidatus Methylomirabilis sp.]